MKRFHLALLIVMAAFLYGCPGGGGGGSSSSSSSSSGNKGTDAEAAAYNPSTGQPLGGAPTPAVAPVAPTPASSYDLSCVCVWNSETNSKKMGGCATAADTVLFVEHYHPAVGTKVRFTAVDGQSVERTIASIRELGPANSVDNYLTDVAKATLDQPLPATVHPASVISYSGTGFIVDQFGSSHSTNLTYGTYATWPDVGLVHFDSGSPVLTVVNGQTCLVSLVTTTTSGPALTTVPGAFP